MKIVREYTERIVIEGPIDEMGQVLDDYMNQGFEILVRGPKPIAPGRVDPSTYRIIATREVDLRRIFYDVFDLLDGVAEQADDTLWFNVGTTAHESLIELAARHGQLSVVEELQTRMEEPDKYRFLLISRGVCPDCGGPLDDSGVCSPCHCLPALDPEYQKWLGEKE